MEQAATADVRNDVKILGLVSAGHFCSHFYMLTLPALFIFLNRDLGISFTLLGAMLSARYISTGMAQVPAGFMVDRYGAKPVLMIGIFVMVTAFALMAFAPNYWVLVALVVVGGIGDSVFHPADYSILNGSVSEARMGRAFSIHTFAGHLGFAAAPVAITLMSTLWDWRTALMVVAGIGYVILILLLTQWSSLKDDSISPKRRKKAEETADDKMSDHRKLLLSRPVLVLFSFFAMSTLAGNGLHSFAIPVLNALHGTSVVDAGFAVGTYMLVSSFAVLVGGVIADKITRQDHFAAGVYAVSIIAVLAISLFQLHYVLLVLFFSMAGFCHGVVRPARDMMVREITPEGSSGKVFGFIFTGQNVGGGIAPVLLGFMLDNYPPQYVFYASIGFLVLCVITILLPRGPMTKRAPTPAE
ncbi:MAG: FSR family fosmidomycin resistance protein-like MFS transporter [Alphaproteobacteria bacterium]|jgi:FSR family fosmidomycin resistance protein-like MFS transporter